ncbi:hypothetical protein HDU81_001934 [Chytriomyces hyalinus]|nr:hypothetical protein HDU81_001934 [Chytriomyces hyalinus]
MLFRTLLCLLATVSISHQSPIVLDRRQTPEQIQALQALQVVANPVVQAEIQKQIGAVLNAQAGAPSAATTSLAQIQALLAQTVGATPAPGIPSAVAAYQTQIQALQAQLVGAEPAVQAQIQQEIDSSLSVQLLLAAIFNGVACNGCIVGANSGRGDTGGNGNPNAGNSNAELSGTNALCDALTAQMNKLENQLAGVDAPTRAAIQQQQQAIISQMAFC